MMKKFLITTSILLGWMVFNSHLVRSQTGNMSDITMPNPGEIIHQNPKPNRSDDIVNSPDPEDIIPPPLSEEVIETDISETLDTGNQNNLEPETQIDNSNQDLPTADSPENINSDTTDIKEPNLEEPSVAESPTETATTDPESPTETATTDPESPTETAATTEEETTETNTEQVAQDSDIETPIDTQVYEVQLQQSSPELALLMQEESYAVQIASYSNIEIYGEAPSVEQISQRLGELWQQTAKKTAFINVSLQKKQLESFTILPSVPPSLASTEVSQNQLVQPEKIALRNTIKNTPRKTLLATAKEFRQEISNPHRIHQNNYLAPAQELYELIIAPIEAELAANDIDTLVFAMDSGLRLLPLAALHDGEQFLIEKYAVAIVPSFGLTDTRYVNLSQSSILAMGASEFKEEKPSLPAMPIELKQITHNASRGEIYLNEDFTVANFKAQNRRSKPFSIIHLGTHAEFNAEKFSDSYIQFYDEKLQLSALRRISDELGWSSSENPPVELLVLSACETALGDEEAELGFAGLALQTGVKSALASLWYVSDLGTLALMGEFYDRLDDTLIKAEALRQTQLRMLTGEVSIEDRYLKLSNGEGIALPADFPLGNLTFSHPYFWSSFTLIGNWN